jgi:hypothetical protein
MPHTPVRVGAAQVHGLLLEIEVAVVERERLGWPEPKRPGDPPQITR